MSTISLTINSRDRLELSTTIEALINMLDDLEPDVDLEPATDAEPTLGWPDQHHGRGTMWLDPRDSCGDLELDRCDDEDGHDLEPEETDHNGDEGDYTIGSEDEADSRSWHIDPTMRFMGGSGL